MPLLIKNARILTMTEAGDFHGDVLIDSGRIVRVEPDIDILESAQVLDANGLVLTPGMIDMYVHDDGSDPAFIAQEACACGVTTHLFVPDERVQSCILTNREEQTETALRCIDPAMLSDTELSRMLQSSRYRLILPIRHLEQCSRVLSMLDHLDHRPILAELTGCAGAASKIAASGCGAIISVHRGGGVSPWQLAAELDAQGVQVAVSCSYPSAKLKLLTVCAGLCMRDGMPRSRALRTITCNPASMLGLLDRGRIAPGCRADLVLFDGDPLLLATSHVMTIANGRIFPSNCS